MTDSRSAESSGIGVGARVVLRDRTADQSRKHLRTHSTHGDVGTVVEASRVALVDWVNVRFDGCPNVHRLAEDEVLLHQGAKT